MLYYIYLCILHVCVFVYTRKHTNTHRMCACVYIYIYIYIYIYATHHSKTIYEKQGIIRAQKQKESPPQNVGMCVKGIVKKM